MAPKQRRDGIYKRGRFWWVRTDPVTGRQITTGRTDKAAALLWVAGRERLAADPSLAASQEERLVDWGARFLRMVLKRGRRPKTVEYYGKKFGPVVRIFGEHAVLADVDPGSLDVYVQKRREEACGESTIAAEVALIIRVLKLAKRAGCYPGDVSVLKPLDVSAQYKPKERALTPAELRALIAELNGPELAIVFLCSVLGMRLGEALRARPEDFDFQENLVNVRGTKTEQSARTVPILSVFRELVEAASVLLPVPVQPANFYRTLRRACARAGIEYCTPNDLRRTHATILLEHEVAPYTVSKLLGHTSEAMVRRVYGKPRAKALGEAAERALAQRNVFVTPHTPEEPCTPANVSAKCADSNEEPTSGDHIEGLFNPLVLGSSPSRPTSKTRRQQRLSRICNVPPEDRAWALDSFGEAAAAIPPGFFEIRFSMTPLGVS